MKRVALVAALAFAVTSALAANDIHAAVTSSAAVIAAIDASAKNRFGDFVFLPGYGLTTDSYAYGKDLTPWTDDFAQIKGMSAVLRQTFKGLDPNEYVSFNFRVVHYSNAPDDIITARQKFSGGGKPEAWEVWLNGVKQP